MTARNRTKEESGLTTAQIMRRALIFAPFPVVRRIPGKSWAGALITRDDLDLGRYGKGREGAYSAGEDVPYYGPDSHQSI